MYRPPRRAAAFFRPVYHTRLGKAGVSVSRLCLGTLNFGNTTAPDEAGRILDAAEDAGINFLDTADNYGGETNRGAAEAIIGQWLTGAAGRRDRIVLATKVCNPMGPGPNDRGLSAYHIKRACEASLRRLRSERIDVYQMHKFDPATPLEEVWQAFGQLIDEGKVLYVGCSNFFGWHMAEAQRVAASLRRFGLCCGQSLYNLIERQLEHETLDAYRGLGIGLLPWSPLAEGLLAGTLPEARFGSPDAARLRAAHDRCRPQLIRYERWCAETGFSPAAVALAWLLHQPGVTAPVIGPSRVEHLRESVAATEVKLDATMLAALDEIWPAPERWVTRPTRVAAPSPASSTAAPT